MENGTAIRQEFDVVGEVTNYKPKTNAPAALWETLLRPAPKSHVIYHLGRLAAHRRNTRGGEAFQVIMEDIALDVGDVSEWAVVMACAEMRKKNSAWFPNTGEILDIIKKYSSMLENLYVKRLEGAKPAEGKSFNRRDMNNYYKNPKENPLRRELCDFLLQKGEPDYFDFTAMYSNYQLEIVAASKYGWRSATINGGSVAPDPDQAPMLD